MSLISSATRSRRQYVGNRADLTSMPCDLPNTSDRGRIFLPLASRRRKHIYRTFSHHSAHTHGALSAISTAFRPACTKHAFRMASFSPLIPGVALSAQHCWHACRKLKIFTCCIFDKHIYTKYSHPRVCTRQPSPSLPSPRLEKDLRRMLIHCTRPSHLAAWSKGKKVTSRRLGLWGCGSHDH